MNKEIIDEINNCIEDSAIYSNLDKHLENILCNGKLKRNDIQDIIQLKNYLFISDFLTKYTFFDQGDLIVIHNFINKNLDNTDRLFVSDLIEFASYWNLDLLYEKCLNFLDKYENDDHYVLLATLEYIFKNLKFEFVDQIVEKLIDIINNRNQIQTAQVYASFILFRITLKKEYLSNLIELVVKNDHKILLRNILNLEYNNQQYFDYHDLLIGFCEACTDVETQ